MQQKLCQVTNGRYLTAFLIFDNSDSFSILEILKDSFSEIVFQVIILGIYVK